MTGLVDHRGQPLRKEVLTREVAGATIGGVRSPMTGYPGDGLTPVRLARILRAADMGDPLAYFELAEQIEERDLHYAGVLGTRKRAVSQVDVTINPASDSPLDVRIADMCREWIDRDELADETFDILDGVGKGDGFTEIIWDTSEGQWRPERLEWRDPRWFTYDSRDGRIAVASQWRAIPLANGRVHWQGMDYAGVRAGLRAARIALTANQWAGLQIMENAAASVLNGYQG